MLIVTSLTLSFRLFGQIQIEAIELLSKKDFKSFKTFTDNLDSSEKGILYRSTVNRDVTNDFKEAVFYFIRNNPDTNSEIATVRVRMLHEGKVILYYLISSSKNEVYRSGSREKFDTIAYYKNDSLFSSLEHSFFSSFGAKLNVQELFIDTLVYGEACGLMRVVPHERIIIDSLVKMRNKGELFKLLTSSNFEKQLYAVDGLFQISRLGAKYNNDELNLINNVLNKEGNIYSCNGCALGFTDVQYLKSKFRFE
jgi:hypothetical protein